MNQYEFLIDRLREVAKGMDHPQRRTLIQAADALENQRSEIESLKQICEKQAGLNQRVLDLALELDRTKAEGVSLLKRLDMADAERDIVTKHKIELEQELASSNKQVAEVLQRSGFASLDELLANYEQVKYERDLPEGQLASVASSEPEPSWKRRFLGTFLKGADE